MRPVVENANRHRPDPTSLRVLKALIAVLTAAVIIVGAYLIVEGPLGDADQVSAAELGPNDAPESPVPPTNGSTTTTIPSTTTTLPEISNEPPPPGELLVIPPTEAQPEAKQLAVNIAYALTTYEESDDHVERLEALRGDNTVALLAEAGAPLIYDGFWSRGEVIYPQMGGLSSERASVMVVTRQTVGTGSEAVSSVVRTLDIRLVRGESGWEFEYLSSAGGVFGLDEDLTVAHAVASDPRINMPDSARLDILSGLVSPKLLDLMSELADHTSYEVVTLATGHPYHVFDTDRVSRHTVGQAVDINRIGSRLVIDDREPGSVTLSIVEWLFDHPDVQQVGSPWDVDGKKSSRSFTNEVHQDHIHLAVTPDS
jgi:hypothetical protein